LDRQTALVERQVVDWPLPIPRPGMAAQEFAYHELTPKQRAAVYDRAREGARRARAYPQYGKPPAEDQIATVRLDANVRIQFTIFTEKEEAGKVVRRPGSAWSLGF
jgi:hypothetical protein